MSQPSDQNFGNHTRFDALYHYVTAPLTVAVFIWYAFHAAKLRTVESVMALLAATVLLLLVALVRTYPLKVQDRVIRLEEQMRLMRVLPPDLHSRIAEFTPRQLVAMRFASDAELADLARVVLADRIGGKEIKQQIKNWRADHFRV